MKILFISLGCDKNLADSETMLGLLAPEDIRLWTPRRMRMSLL